MTTSAPEIPLWDLILTTLESDDRVTPAQIGFVRLAVPTGIMNGQILYLDVPNDFTKAQIDKNLRIPIMDALAQHGGEVSSYRAIVNEEVANLPNLAPHASAATEPASESAPNAHSTSDYQPIPSYQPPHTGGRNTFTQEHLPTSSIPVNVSVFTPSSPTGMSRHDSRLNPKYTFENFVIGQSNRFAHAAAVAVAEAPAKAYNPLFIYGDSGLGKTHLLHAIGWYAQEMYPGVKVRYVSSEEFTNDFINSIANNKGAEFQARYREVDILLIDDIQFLQGRAETQEAFFHTFNTLHDHNKQVVITSDVAPKFLTGFEDRMRSRFEWGLITDVQAPDLETRIAILRKKAQSDALHVPDDVLEYIATVVSSNIRELEGAVIRVSAYANLNRLPLDQALAQQVLRDIVDTSQDNIVSPTDIISTTANYFKLKVDDLYGKSRTQQVALARQIAMYLCRERTNLSLPKIGQLFGGRDHTTVMYANNKIAELMRERRQVYNQVNDITQQLARR